jgi:hypothetical protein
MGGGKTQCSGIGMIRRVFDPAQYDLGIPGSGPERPSRGHTSTRNVEIRENLVRPRDRDLSGRECNQGQVHSVLQ